MQHHVVMPHLLLTKSHAANHAHSRCIDVQHVVHRRHGSGVQSSAGLALPQCSSPDARRRPSAPGAAGSPGPGGGGRGAAAWRKIKARGVHVRHGQRVVGTVGDACGVTRVTKECIYFAFGCFFCGWERVLETHACMDDVVRATKCTSGHHNRRPCTPRRHASCARSQRRAEVSRGRGASSRTTPAAVPACSRRATSTAARRRASACSYDTCAWRVAAMAGDEWRAVPRLQGSAV